MLKGTPLHDSKFVPLISGFEAYLHSFFYLPVIWPYIILIPSAI